MEFRREGEGYSQSAFTRPSLLSPTPAGRNGADPPPPSSASPPAAPRAPPATSTEATDSTTVSRYHECLRNHAAAIGGYVLDGCGEFMLGGTDDGPLKCAACGCHRSFHRREAAEGELIPFYHRLHNGNPNSNPRLPLLLPPPPLSRHHRGFPPSPIVASGGTTTESSSEELGAGAVAAATPSSSKKRFRTKFTQEQKGLMMQFAESVDWRIQKQHDAAMEQFCKEIGISRQVLKVWMHNHKHAMIRKPDQVPEQQHPHETHQPLAHQDETLDA